MLNEGLLIDRFQDFPCIICLELLIWCIINGLAAHISSIRDIYISDSQKVCGVFFPPILRIEFLICVAKLHKPPDIPKIRISPAVSPSPHVSQKHANAPDQFIWILSKISSSKLIWNRNIFWGGLSAEMSGRCLFSGLDDFPQWLHSLEHFTQLNGLWVSLHRKTADHLPWQENNIRASDKHLKVGQGNINFSKPHP